MLNVIIATGRLVNDPELRKTNSDKSICQFTLAIDNTRKEVDGTRGTCFLDCVLFNERAELVCQALRKGSKVAVHGSLNQRNFVRQDGSKGRVYEIAVNSIEFLDPKPHNQETEDYDGPFDSAGSLDGESYIAEDGQEKVLKAKQPEPQFDPYTGKPLKPKAKK